MQDGKGGVVILVVRVLANTVMVMSAPPYPSIRAMAGAAAALMLAACAGERPASIGEFSQVLASHDSATLALGVWCERRELASPATIRAEPAGAGSAAAITAEVRAQLALGADEPFGYRHVALRCGETTMSVAHNFYVPARLTEAMNVQLATTNTPFGRVVQPLDFSRERLDDVMGPAPECPADTIMTHRAVLRRADGLPISFVIECYTPANLAP